MAVKNALNFQIPVIVTLLALYPLIAVPYVLPRWSALVTISLFALYVIFKENVFVYDRSLVPLGFFLLFAFISASFSPHFQEAWMGSPGYLTGFVTYLFFAILFIIAFGAAVRYPGKIEAVINIWLLSASLIAFVGLLQYLGLNLLPLGSETLKSAKSASTIYNSNDLGTYLVMAFPFAALRFLQKPGCFSAVILSLVYATLLTTLCRSAWVGLAPGLLLLFIYYPEKRKLLVLLALLLAVTLALLPVNEWRLLRQAGSFYEETEKTLTGDPEGGSARNLLWQEGFKALPQSPLVGTGPDTFYYVSPEKFGARFGEGARAAGKAHNIFLEIAVTMGIPALLAYLWFLFTIMRGTDLRRPLELAFFLMVIMYMVRGLFLVDVITVYPLFWVLLGLYQGVKATQQREGMPKHTLI